MNAILFFFWHGLAENVINAIYYDPPKPGGGLMHWPGAGALLGADGFIYTVLLSWIGDKVSRFLVYELLKLGVYLGVAVLCYRRNYFWKI